MSGRVVGRVFERTLGSPTQKAVLLCLAEHANPDGEMSFPSVRRISLETELGESTVRKALSELRSRTLIFQAKPPCRHRPATYTVNLEALSGLPLVEVYHPDLSVEEPRPLPQSIQPSITEQPDLSVMAPNRPLTVLEPPEEPATGLRADGNKRVVEEWEASVGPITAGVAQDLFDMVDEASLHILTLPKGAGGTDLSGIDWVIEAIREARRSARGGRFGNTKYLSKILGRWIMDGFKAQRSGPPLPPDEAKRIQEAMIDTDTRTDDQQRADLEKGRQAIIEKERKMAETRRGGG